MRFMIKEKGFVNADGLVTSLVGLSSVTYSTEACTSYQARTKREDLDCSKLTTLQNFLQVARRVIPQYHAQQSAMAIQVTVGIDEAQFPESVSEIH